MKLDGLSLQFIKELYMIKVSATDRNDQLALNHMKERYPELFNAKFLIDILKKYFEKHDKLKINPNLPFQKFMTKIH